MHNINISIFGSRSERKSFYTRLCKLSNKGTNLEGEKVCLNLEAYISLGMGLSDLLFHIIEGKRF